MEHILDKIGLTYFWGKIKATFAKKSELEAHPTARVYVGSCSTAAATNPKVCTVETFPLNTEGKPLVGTLISVKFSATNTSTSTTPELNVNGTGAIRIWYNNAVLTAAKSAYAGYANRYINYMYDGTYWVFLGHSTDNNTTYSALTQAKIDAGTETTGRLISADLLRDNFYTEGEVDDLLSGKEDTISTVNVSVDNNTGTPSGSASVSGGTLSLSFQNLKGATGAQGPQGIQGVQGVQGPKGDTGVTGDASSLAIIHGIDKTSSYATTDVCGADAAQALLNEIEGGFYY